MVVTTYNSKYSLSRTHSKTAFKPWVKNNNNNLCSRFLVLLADHIKRTLYFSTFWMEGETVPFWQAQLPLVSILLGKNGLTSDIKSQETHVMSKVSEKHLFHF